MESAVAVELEIPGIPKAPEDGEWRLEPSGTKNEYYPYKITLFINGEEWFNLLTDCRDESIVNASMIVLRRYRHSRRHNLITSNMVVLVPQEEQK